MKQKQKLFLSILFLTSYLTLLGYGTLCLVDHDLELLHTAKTSHPFSSSPHEESKDSKGLLHSCLVTQNLLSTSLVVILLFLTLVLIAGRHHPEQEEEVYQRDTFFYTSRSPPFFRLTW